MSDLRPREASRVYFRAPARIRGPGGIYDVRIEDISWTGVRLRVERTTLNLKPDAGIGAAAASVEVLLGSAFPVTLDHAGENPGVLKNTTLVRVSLPDGDPDVLDLGCLFRGRLTEVEAESLGLAMTVDTRAPSEVRQPSAWGHEHAERLHPVALEAPDLLGRTGAPEPEPTTYEPVVPLKAVIAHREAGGAGPVVSHLESFTGSAIRIRARAELLPFKHRWDRPTVAQVAMRFSELYGDHVALEIVHRARRVWQGPVSVVAVEVDPKQPRDLLLDLGVGRPLLRSEIKRIRHGGAQDAA